MKIRFYCDSGANIHSYKEEVVDIADYWGLSEKDARIEWDAMTDEEKYEEAEKWEWNGGLDIGYEEI